MTAASRIIDRLDGVRQTGSGRWKARCPAHPDRSPSLSIREMDDGRVLIHDFGGCDTGDVLAALRLELADLFDKPVEHCLPRSRSSIPARDLLDLVCLELDVAGILIAEIVGGSGCSQVAWQRLTQASQRINVARSYAHGR